MCVGYPGMGQGILKITFIFIINSKDTTHWVSSVTASDQVSWKKLYKAKQISLILPEKKNRGKKSLHSLIYECCKTLANLELSIGDTNFPYFKSLESRGHELVDSCKDFLAHFNHTLMFVGYPGMGQGILKITFIFKINSKDTTPRVSSFTASDQVSWKNI